jgi:hypothetical protein
MSRATSPISGKPYGLAAMCRVWQLTRSGPYAKIGTMLNVARTNGRKKKNSSDVNSMASCLPAAVHVRSCAAHPSV